MTKQETQETKVKIKLLKQVIKEKSKQVNPDISYSLQDLFSGKITECPNQKLLNEIFACKEELERLQNLQRLQDLQKPQTKSLED